jgi:hypothetical protein
MDDPTIQAGIALGFVLTLMIYSYLLGDNPLYRLAVHLLVGVGMGYATVVIIHTVFIPQLITPFQQILSGVTLGAGERIQPVVALLGVFLLLKLSPRTAPLGNLTMGFVMGVGAAVAVAGAVLGTLLPQISATALSLLPDSKPLVFPDGDNLTNMVAAWVLITGTITSFLYFHFSARPITEDQTERPGWVKLSARVGQVFLMITFGSLFAGALIASLSVLTERMRFYIEWLSQWLV